MVAVGTVDSAAGKVDNEGGRLAISASPREPTRGPAVWAQRLLRHRVVHFALLGGVTYALAPKEQDPRVLNVSAEEIRNIWTLNARRESVKALTPEQKERALSQLVEDELLYREGVRLGLDRDDGIVRARVIQKMMFYAEDLAGASSPTSDENLRAYHARTANQWQQPPLVRLEQVFVSFVAHPDDGQAFAGKLRAQLVADATIAPATLSGTFPATRLKEWNNPADITAELGEGIAKATLDLPVNTWSVPVQSAYGWHLIRIKERRPGGPAKFEDIRQELVISYRAERKQNALESLYQRLLKEYKVNLESPPGETVKLPATGTKRMPAQGGE